jgi:hypothetical protein
VAGGTRVEVGVLVATAVEVIAGIAVELGTWAAGMVVELAASSAEVVGLSEESAAVVVGETVIVAVIVGAADP